MSMDMNMTMTVSIYVWNMHVSTYKNTVYKGHGRAWTEEETNKGRYMID
jgi:hypothetical protein